MSRYMIESVPEKCKACRRCEIACIAAHHGLTFKEALKKRDELVARVHVVKSGSVKSPISCRQCENAPCARICPTGALQQDDGIVTMNAQICSGCQLCIMACPYGVRAYDTGKDKGVIEKCTMCAHLIDKGEKPACVKHCPGQARKFGDLDDPQSDVSKLRAAKKTYKLKDVGNHPGVDYAMDKCAWKGDE